MHVHTDYAHMLMRCGYLILYFNMEYLQLLSIIYYRF